MNGGLLLGRREGGEWHLGADTLGQWLMAGAYIVAAVLCSLCARKGPGGVRGDEKFWLGFGIFLLAVAISKIVDLPNWITFTGRRLAQEEGWYTRRWRWQAGAILCIATLALAAVAALWHWKCKLRHKIVLGIGVFLVGLLLVRTISFHFVDPLIARPLVGELRLGYFLEGCGVVFIGLTALWTRLGTIACEECLFDKPFHH